MRPSQPRRRRLLRWMRPVWLGTLRRTQPLSRQWGYDRGRPIDRYYIERFLTGHRSDIRGRVLEVKEPLYTERLGSAVELSDVLDIDGTNPRATLVADLTATDGLPPAAFDCFILTQTLQYIYQLDAAIRQSHRLLRPGGVLLATVPAVSRVADPPALDYWRLTAAACSRLFGDVFGHQHVEVRTHGNVLACISFLTGLAQHELNPAELDAHDPLFPVVVTVRAVKAADASR